MSWLKSRYLGPTEEIWKSEKKSQTTSGSNLVTDANGNMTWTITYVSPTWTRDLGPFYDYSRKEPEIDPEKPINW